jgi:hypothetical protein
VNSGELSTVHWVGLELGQTKMVWAKVRPNPKKEKYIWTDIDPTSLPGRLWADFGPPLSWADFGPFRMSSTHIFGLAYLIIYL